MHVVFPPICPIDLCIEVECTSDGIAPSTKVSESSILYEASASILCSPEVSEINAASRKMSNSVPSSKYLPVFHLQLTG